MRSRQAPTPNVSPRRIARLAARATGADDSWLWLADADVGTLELAAAHGDPRPASTEAAE